MVSTNIATCSGTSLKTAIFFSNFIPKYRCPQIYVLFDISSLIEAIKISAVILYRSQLSILSNTEIIFIYVMKFAAMSSSIMCEYIDRLSI